MITREILDAQKQLYEAGYNQVVSQIKAVQLELERLTASASAFGGGVEAMDTLLNLLDGFEAAKASGEESAFLHMVPPDGKKDEELDP